MRTNAPTFYPFAVVNNDESVFTRVYIYIYIYPIYTRGTRRIGRPSTLLFIQLDRGKIRERKREREERERAKCTYVIRR